MSKKTIYLEDAINALHTEIVKRRISEDVNDDGSLDEFDTESILRRLPSARPDWGKPVGDGRPLADSEVVPRLRDIQKQIGGSYAIDRAIEVLERLQDAQPEREWNYCEGCKHRGMWENEVEYGYNSPCTNCAERVSSNYEPER